MDPNKDLFLNIQDFQNRYVWKNLSKILTSEYWMIVTLEDETTL